MIGISSCKPKHLKLFSCTNVMLKSLISANAVVTNIDSESSSDISFSEENNDIERKRNKSGLNEQHRNILNGTPPYSKAQDWFHETVKYRRKLLGKYGSQSGVNPGIMWPTKAELEEMKEYERIAYPYTLQEAVMKCIQRKEAREAKIRERDENVARKVEKLEVWKEELRLKIAKKEEAAALAKAKKEKLVEEVRRHFGFKIDPRDERFKEMLEKKEKEEKKKAKEAKRKEREANLLAKLAAAAKVVPPSNPNS